MANFTDNSYRWKRMFNQSIFSSEPEVEDIVKVGGETQASAESATQTPQADPWAFMDAYKSTYDTGNTKEGPRGFRNNNWCNIRISNNPWEGKITNNTDDTFEQFETPELGIRAAAINLRTYKKKGISTVNDIISTWAPSTENDTNSYVQAVSQYLQVDPNAVIDVENPDTMRKLLTAIVRVENGQDGDADVIARGVDLAFNKK